MATGDGLPIAALSPRGRALRGCPSVRLFGTMGADPQRVHCLLIQIEEAKTCWIPSPGLSSGTPMTCGRSRIGCLVVGRPKSRSCLRGLKPLHLTGLRSSLAGRGPALSAKLV